MLIFFKMAPDEVKQTVFIAMTTKRDNVLLVVIKKRIITSSQLQKKLNSTLFYSTQINNFLNFYIRKN